MTVVHISELGASARLSADVVVLGGGPAGLTVALDLAAAGVDVVVLESGTGNPATTRELDAGEVVGAPLVFGGIPMDLTGVRMRALGGSSGHWAGMCRPLDQIDFTARPWMASSGWPITRDDLDPWYVRAAETLQLGTTGFESEAWFARTGAAPLLLPGPLDTVVYQFSPPVRFGTAFHDVLSAPEGPRVVLGSTAVEVARDASGRRITAVSAVGLRGEALEVAASSVVLAAGGYEVARLLLSWDAERGVANSSGLVGRGFADHPHRNAGQVRVLLDGARPALYGWGRAPGDELPVSVWAGWSPTDDAQREMELANGVVLLRFADGPVSAVAEPTGVSGEIGPLLEWSRGRVPTVASIDVRTEQRGNPASRITLGRQRDATGLRRVRLDWQPTALDDENGRRLVDLFARELGRSGAGRVEVDPRGRPFGTVPINIGCHPMGTARMSDDPSLGVVDADLRAHDVENLFVCSSAVFPTGGHANPTMTIVALAHRLAAHLVSG